jgi:hypothetical protein
MLHLKGSLGGQSDISDKTIARVFFYGQGWKHGSLAWDYKEKPENT